MALTITRQLACYFQGL